MCGRYFFDGDTWGDIMRLTGGAPEESASACEGYLMDEDFEKIGDIYPSEEAIVLTGDRNDFGTVTVPGSKHALHAAKMRWGFPGFKEGQLLINARAETALEKKTFSESVLHRRCIIPAKWFYEWDRDKNKVTFEWPASPSVYMAGFYDFGRAQNCYVILTTQANDSMRCVHDRMPLIFPEEAIRDWIYDDAKAMELLKISSPELASKRDYEQLSLF